MTNSKVFQVEGMKCQGCVAELEQILDQKDSVVSFRVSLEPPQIALEFQSNPASIEVVNDWLPAKYQLKEAESGASDFDGTSQIGQQNGSNRNQEKANGVAGKSLTTYWPLILVIGYILVGTFVAMSISSYWQWDFAMRMFMGLFFVAFSFFKLLDLKGFADAYLGYDWVARTIPTWGFVYPFVELSLGVCYLLGVAPLIVNWVTLVVMSISIGGVIESVTKKRTIQCACLGTGFNLPMSQVTIIEDGAMIAMAAVMIIHLSF